MPNLNLKNKINNLPLSPGIYLYKDQNEIIIYVGKAKKLKNRVKQYFQNIEQKDAKTKALINEITGLDYMEVESELEAFFLEAEMIRRYLPKYNILLRDDKSLNYIRIDYDSLYPTVVLTRRPLDDGAKYFGPYLNGVQIKLALKFLRKIFPYAISKNQNKVTLDYYLGLDPGLGRNKTPLSVYRSNLRKLMMVIEGKQQKIETDLTKTMNQLAGHQKFEAAAKVRNQLIALKQLNDQVMFHRHEFSDLKKDEAITQLMTLLNLENLIQRIEGYDISHMSGTNVVASMVVFINGVSSKVDYRKFKTKIDHNNDFYNMKETIFRRFSDKNLSNWGQPDLILIDGGKGQLSAAIEARNLRKNFQVPFIGLAKKNEQIIIQQSSLDGQPASLIELNQEFVKKYNIIIQQTDNFLVLNIDKNLALIKLLQRVRDESHRFAVSYHSVLKRQNSLKSSLDNIIDIGPVTKRKLLKKYGSVDQIKKTTEKDLVQFIGSQKAKIIKKYL